MKQMLFAAALLSPFFFPILVTGALVFLAAIFYPLSPLLVGLSLDALYYSRGAALMPWYTIYGAGISLAAYLVHRFIETSIMHS